MTPCTPRRIIPVGVATYIEYATLGLAGLGILGFIIYAVKVTADAVAKKRYVHACRHSGVSCMDEPVSAYDNVHPQRCSVTYWTIPITPSITTATP